MKSKNLLRNLLLACVLPLSVTAQTKQVQGEETPKLFEIKGYFEGFEVDSYRKLQKDTLFFVDKKILVYPGWYEKNIEGKDYILIRYPRFGDDAAATSIGVTPTDSIEFPVYEGLWKHDNKMIAIKRADFEKLEKNPVYGTGLIFGKTASRYGFKMVSGQLTLPFKLRPAIGEQKFQMTTDVTIGAYGGIRARLSQRQNIFLTIPATVGLSYINLNSNSSSATLPANQQGDRIVPGVTWASGLLLQVNKFNAGFVFGKDYASQVADGWIYHNQFWYSFAIGFSFSTLD